MRFQPKTAEEIAEMRVLPDGIYPFEISGGEDTKSKKGNEMIKLTVRVFKPDGDFMIVDDYLLESMLFKLLHACEACGLTKEYDSGELTASDFIGKTGTLKLKIQQGNLKDPGDPNSERYPDRNSIADYVVTPDEVVTKTKKTVDIEEDEIPF